MSMNNCPPAWIIINFGDSQGFGAGLCGGVKRISRGKSINIRRQPLFLQNLFIVFFNHHYIRNPRISYPPTTTSSSWITTIATRYTRIDTHRQRHTMSRRQHRHVRKHARQHQHVMKTYDVKFDAVDM